MVQKHIPVDYPDLKEDSLKKKSAADRTIDGVIDIIIEMQNLHVEEMNDNRKSGPKIPKW